AHEIADDRRGPADLVVRRRVPVGTVFLAHHVDRQAAAQGDLLGAHVPGKRRRLLHAEIDQDRLEPARGDQLLHEADVLATRIEIADDRDASWHSGTPY